MHVTWVHLSLILASEKKGPSLTSLQNDSIQSLTQISIQDRRTSKAAIVAKRAVSLLSRTQGNKLSPWEAYAHVISGSLGGGVLEIQVAYMKCGLWTGAATTFVLGIFLMYCENLLVKSAQALYNRLELPPMTYPDLIEKAVEHSPFVPLRKYKNTCRYIGDATMWTSIFGACCTYHIIMAQTIQNLLETKCYIILPLRLYIMFLFVPLVLISWIKSLKLMAPLSVIANSTMIVCVIATVYYSLEHAPHISTVPAWKNLLGFFEYAGVAIFAMEGGVVLIVENNMDDPLKFPEVLLAGECTVVVIIMAMGFFGYWGFGENCKSPMTKNFPLTTFPIILKSMIAVMMYFTYTLNFTAAFNLYWRYAKNKYAPAYHYFWERVDRSFIVIIISVIAIAFPAVNSMMGLLGAVLGTHAAFIFPAVLNIMVYWEAPGMGRYKWRLWKNTMIITLGYAMLVVSAYANAKALIDFLSAEDAAIQNKEENRELHTIGTSHNNIFYT